MFKLVIRVWHYSAAVLTNLFNERADPEIQIRQAIEEGQQAHLRLVDAAAGVIGQSKDVEIKIARTTAQIQRLDRSASQALRLADEARAKGELASAASFERNAQIFAAQLATAEGSLTDLHELHERAAMTAAAARRTVEQNKIQLQRQIAERTRMLSDLAAARMQERLAEMLRAMDRLAPESTIPSLPQIQDRIDRRIAKSAGQIEIALDGVESTMLQVERAVLDERGAEVLAQIREREGLAEPKGEER